MNLAPFDSKRLSGGDVKPLLSETEEGDLAADDGEPLLDLVKVEADRVAGVQPAPRLS
jgi:hypothetical protein